LVARTPYQMIRPLTATTTKTLSIKNHWWGNLDQRIPLKRTIHFPALQRSVSFQHSFLKKKSYPRLG
jgi:hypothetical protein